MITSGDFDFVIGTSKFFSQASSDAAAKYDIKLGRAGVQYSNGVRTSQCIRHQKIV
jgi:hypothetical protein